MKINNAGLSLIKSFEGCPLTAYQDAIGVWTIGWGHTSGVNAGMKITQKQADDYLKKDVAKFEKAVDALGIDFNENQFSALVSFAFNCGEKNLKKLCNGRSKAEIGTKMLLYDKANGKTLPGLTRRRKAENKLYNTPFAVKEAYPVPSSNLKRGSKGETVKWLQSALNRKGADLEVDGIFGAKTEQAVKDFQTKVYVTGIMDEATQLKLME